MVTLYTEICFTKSILYQLSLIRMPLCYFVYRNLLYQVCSVPTLNLLRCHFVTLCTEICCTNFILYQFWNYSYAIWLLCVPKFVVPSLFCTNFKLSDKPFGYFVHRNLLYKVYFSRKKCKRRNQQQHEQQQEEDNQSIKLSCYA